jgi:hypothetical protein
VCEYSSGTERARDSYVWDVQTLFSEVVSMIASIIFSVISTQMPRDGLSKIVRVRRFQRLPFFPLYDFLVHSLETGPNPLDL